MEATWVAAAVAGENGFVGGLSATVAFGREMVGVPPPGSGVFAVLSAMVGAPIGALEVTSLIVGAGGGDLGMEMVGAPTAGADAVGGPEVAGFGALGAEGGVGAFAVAVGGSVADGMAGGASAALSVTRTVSFFKGTLEVCLEGVLFSLSFSLMRFGLVAAGNNNAIRLPLCQTRSSKKW